MTEIFLQLVNMSITAGWLILAVLILRLLLKKTPKWVSCLLWGLVGIKLLVPVSIESVFSLIPSSEVVTQELLYATTPVIDSGIDTVNQVVNPVLQESFTPNPGDSVNPLQIVTFLASYVWVLGMAVLLIYTIVTYTKLKLQVCEAVRLRGNVFQSERVVSPFILGVVKPRIYVPYGLSEEELTCVTAHEEAHIKRRDHLWKPLAFLILTVYWFNPLVWIAYILLCRDIEYACDEKVLRQMGTDKKKVYSEALLRCSVSQRTSHKMIAACPVAFGEVGVKSRIKSVLNYKKPAFWVIVIALLACLVCAVCFMTSPKEDVAEEEVVRKDVAAENAARENVAREQAEKEYAEKMAEEEPAEKEMLYSPPTMVLVDYAASVPHAGSIYEVTSGYYDWNYPSSKRGEEMVAIKSSYGSTPRVESLGKELLQMYEYGGVDAIFYGVEFPVDPDRITVREYALDDESETLLSETENDQVFYVLLKHGYVYDVIVEWDKEHLEENGFYGTAHYAFATDYAESEKIKDPAYVYAMLESQEVLVGPPTMVLSDSLSSALNFFNVSADTYSWNRISADSFEETVAIDVDGAAPLEAVKGKQWLPLKEYNLLDFASYSADFSVRPDRVIIREYDLQDMGNESAEVLSEKRYEDIYFFELKPNRIYEVIAEWDEEMLNENGCYGTACYAFATGDTSGGGNGEAVTSGSATGEVWTGEDYQTVLLYAHVKEMLPDLKGYILISSDTDSFPGAFLVEVPEIVYDIDKLSSGDEIVVRMKDTGKTNPSGSIPIYFASYLDKQEKLTGGEGFIIGVQPETMESSLIIGEKYTEEVNTLSGVTMFMEKYKTTEADVEISNQTDKELQYGEYYEIQVLKDGEWYRLQPKNDMIFNQLAYIVPAGVTDVWQTNWEYYYGELPVGTYRMVKDIIDYRAPGDFTQYYLAAEFEIMPSY